MRSGLAGVLSGWLEPENRRPSNPLLAGFSGTECGVVAVGSVKADSAFVAGSGVMAAARAPLPVGVSCGVGTRAWLVVGA